MVTEIWVDIGSGNGLLHDSSEPLHEPTILWYSVECNFTGNAEDTYPSLQWRLMTTMASQITSPAIVYSTVYSDADQRKHQSSASLAFVWGTHRDRWIPRTKGQLRGKCFHLMTSSCWYGLHNDYPKIIAASPRGQWVNSLRPSNTYMRQLTNHHWFR